MRTAQISTPPLRGGRFPTRPGQATFAACVLLLAWPMRPSTPWNTTAIKAEYDFAESDEVGQIAIVYTLENTTEYDYQVAPGPESPLCERLKRERSIETEPGSVGAHSVWVPAKTRVQFPLYLNVDGPKQMESSLSPEETGQHGIVADEYIAREMPNVQGFVLLDRKNRYAVEFPVPKESATHLQDRPLTR